MGVHPIHHVIIWCFSVERTPQVMVEIERVPEKFAELSHVGMDYHPMTEQEAWRFVNNELLKA